MSVTILKTLWPKGVGSIDATHLGGFFDTVSGTLKNRIWGPRAVGDTDLGWMLDVLTGSSGGFGGSIAVSDSGNSRYAVEFVAYFGSVPPSGQRLLFALPAYDNDNPLQLAYQNDGTVIASGYGVGPTQSFTPAPNTPYRVVLAIDKSLGYSNASYRVWYAPLADWVANNPMTLLYTADGVQTYSNYVYGFRMSLFSNAPGVGAMRLQCLRLFNFATWADCTTYPADIDPSQMQTMPTYKVIPNGHGANNPAAGTVADPWDVTQLLDAVSGCGIVGARSGTGCGYGSTLVLDSATYGAFNTGIKIAGSQFAGLNVVTTAGTDTAPTFNGMASLTALVGAGTWTLVSGSTYRNHPGVGTSLATTNGTRRMFWVPPSATVLSPIALAAAAAANEAAAVAVVDVMIHGGAWVAADGSDMLVRLPDSSSPNSSQIYFSDPTLLLGVGTTDSRVSGIWLHGSAGVDYTDPQNASGGGINDAGGTGGACLWSNCKSTYFGKHGMMLTLATTNATQTVTNCEVEFGHSEGSGSQAPWAFYQNNSGGGNVLTFTNNTCRYALWKLDGTAGGTNSTSGANGGTVLSHYGGATVPYTSIIFSGNILAPGGTGQPSSIGVQGSAITIDCSNQYNVAVASNSGETVITPYGSQTSSGAVITIGPAPVTGRLRARGRDLLSRDR